MILPEEITTIVLDFNGVISSDLNAAARSLGDLLGVPLKPEEAYARWRPIYLQASLGRISVEEYWRELRSSSGFLPIIPRPRRIAGCPGSFPWNPIWPKP